MLWASVDELTSLLPWEPPPTFHSVHSGVLSCGVQGRQSGSFASRWTEPRLPSSPVCEDVHLRCSVPLLQLQAWFVSSSSEHGDAAHCSQLCTACLGSGIMGMHVVSPIAGAVRMNHFRDASLAFTGLRLSKSSLDSLGLFFLSLGINNLVKESLLF